SHGHDRFPLGTQNLYGPVGLPPPAPPLPASPPSSPASVPASGPASVPASGPPPLPSGAGYSAPTTHVNPFGHNPVVVRSRAQNLSPRGASRHACAGALQSAAFAHCAHSVSRSGTHIESPSMIAQYVPSGHSGGQGVVQYLPSPTCVQVPSTQSLCVSQGAP